MSKSIIEKLGITAGPWGTHSDDCECNCGFVFDPNSMGAVCKCLSNEHETRFKGEYPSVNEMRSNAKLIAEAPEMLEALIDQAIRLENSEFQRSFEKLKTLVCKITGKPWEEIKELIK